MRIAVVTHAYPREPGDVAGAFIARLTAAHAARGHSVRVILPTDQGRTGQATHDGVSLDWVRYDTPARETLAYRGTMAAGARTPRGALAFWRLVRALTAAVQQLATDVDIVHAHWWVPGGLAARRAARGGGPPFIVTLHGSDVALLGSVPLASRLARRVLDDAAGVSAVSTYLARRASRLTGYAGPIAVQPMPIVSMAEQSATAATTGQLVFVGRLTAQKRVGLAINALRHLPDHVSLTIIGDGPARAELEVVARPLGARVRFTGAVPPDSVAGHLAGAGALVFPAEREGLGLVVAEAIMAGVPVIVAEDGGGVLDLVTPDTGLVVAPSADAFAQATRRVLEDSSWRSRIAAAGAALADRVSPDAVAAAFEHQYAGAIR